jgi:lysophospholipase L1-like esterase
MKDANPSAGIVLSGQNPRGPSAASVDDHAARQRQLNGVSARLGASHVPVYEAFLAAIAGGVFADYVSGDGIHPPALGSQVWRDAFLAEF